MAKRFLSIKQDGKQIELECEKYPGQLEKMRAEIDLLRKRYKDEKIASYKEEEAEKHRAVNRG
jgi:hypothetical protein|tara:strand:+ start:216 stop:404 length:189 start_codon:yes stop_codon:yes gene_type:complete